MIAMGVGVSSIVDGVVVTGTSGAGVGVESLLIGAEEDSAGDGSIVDAVNVGTGVGYAICVGRGVASIDVVGLVVTATIPLGVAVKVVDDVVGEGMGVPMAGTVAVMGAEVERPGVGGVVGCSVSGIVDPPCDINAVGTCVGTATQADMV